jgi:Ca2+-binding RTX toxin-like protein
MAVRLFSSIANNSSIAFNAASDVLRIDNAALSAADFTVASASGLARFSGGGKTITLQTELQRIGPFNVSFDDGSRLVAGDKVSFGKAQATADTLGGSGHDDQLLGLGAADQLNGGGGADLLYGGAGDDTIDGGSGNDTLAGGGGNDAYTIDSLGDRLVEDSLTGAVDIVSVKVNNYVLSDSVYVEKLTLLSGVARGTGNVHANTVVGEGADTNNILAGGGGNDTLLGNGGNDTLSGGADADSLAGGAGDDRLDGGAGSDSLNGGAGNDLYLVDTSLDATGDAGGTDRVKIAGAGFDYTLQGAIEDLDASMVLSGGFTYRGNTAGNAMSDGGGGNTLIGLGGNDVIAGNAGVDSLAGGNGNDTLNGGAGDDMLNGGPNDDVLRDDFAHGDGLFHMAGGDGTDTIRLAGGQAVAFPDVSNFISSIERIDLLSDTMGNAVTLGYADLLAMSDDDTLYVDGNGSDSLAGGASAGLWTNNGEVVPGYYQFTYHGATLYLATDVQNDLAPMPA